MTTLYNPYSSEVWTGVTSNSTSTAMPSSYYNEIASNNMGQNLRVIIDEDILDRFKIKERIKLKVIDAFKTVRFNPDNLWSEPKCLKQNIVQSVKEKSELDIIPQIKTIELKTEK